MNMELKQELSQLKEYMQAGHEEKARALMDRIHQTYTSADEQAEIDAFISAYLKEMGDEADRFVAETEMKVQLLEISKMVSMSYIAKEYFKKSRQWLYQRINGNRVNGKEARFSHEEINQLNFALQDISRKIGSVTIH